MNKRFFMVTIVNDDEDNQIEAHQIQDNIDRYDEHEGSILVREIFKADRTEVYDDAPPPRPELKEAYDNIVSVLEAKRNLQ